ncbi:hypothetical protein O181_059616 [Austropuccinia psidii MF-1]|uniref:Uncharacterized protein n=1 Tax=Austropuccinia psidii MF-1 TaxID=1389203 RepID=A0A9Q3ECI7_9BASI|nr:hypothetical protein [Austropuccinia psidii MF-1]
MDPGVSRKVGEDEKVEVTTPLSVTWKNAKSIIVGDSRSLSTYFIPDRYPIPRVHGKLTQLSQAKFMKAKDSNECFHQSSLTENVKKLPRIIIHCGRYE